MESSLDISSLITRLINQTVPPQTTEKAKQKYLSYFMRIMGARMQPANFKDPNAIKSLITSKLSSSKQERLNGKSPEVK